MDALDSVGKRASEAGILDHRMADYMSWPYPDPQGRRSAKQKHIDDLTEQDSTEYPYRAFKLLSERSYWTRVWIVQEVSVSREVTFICGSRRLSFRHLSAAFLYISHKILRVMMNITQTDLLDLVQGPKLRKMMENTMSPVLSVLSGFRRKYQKEIGSPEPLIELLHRGCVVASSAESNRQSTNPRDRIYGLLGLASDCQVLNIIPDYSITVEEAIRTSRAFCFNMAIPTFYLGASIRRGSKIYQVGFQTFPPVFVILVGILRDPDYFLRPDNILSVVQQNQPIVSMSFQ